MSSIKALFTIILLLISFNNLSQDTISARLFPAGEPILRCFANFHTGISEGDEKSAFELERAYIGYRMSLSKEFDIKIVLDIGSPDDISEFSRIRRYAYFKNAALRYRKSFLTIDFGLIDMRHFKLQEEFWGHRYIEKSFSDRYKFGPTADLGMDVILDVGSKTKIDLTFSNGEGYSNLQRDNTMKVGLGVESELFKGFFVRVYGDVMKKKVMESTWAIFTGYKHKDYFVIGAEYNWKINEGYNEGFNRRGYSIYGSYNLPYNIEIFARYDFIQSNITKNDDKPWDLIRDGSSVIGGVQYQPIKKVKLALCYQDWYPSAKNMDNKAYIYLNLEFKY